MTLVEKVFNCFKDCERFSLQEAYQQNPDKPQESVRARIYEKIGIKFERQKVYIEQLTTIMNSAY